MKENILLLYLSYFLATLPLSFIPDLPFAFLIPPLESSSNKRKIEEVKAGLAWISGTVIIFFQCLFPGLSYSSFLRVPGAKISFRLTFLISSVLGFVIGILCLFLKSEKGRGVGREVNERGHYFHLTD
jgi:hypothetical protein